ncbi:hypothetical protein GCM10023176_12650 [Micromonospora coerulea]|uniref:Uncharacterized protein n=1 Tax=Micromonospora coerulea TaxID=47856 RepID=A0ABP8S9W2_9ACTN
MRSTASTEKTPPEKASHAAALPVPRTGAGPTPSIAVGPDVPTSASNAAAPTAVHRNLFGGTRTAPSGDREDERQTRIFTTFVRYAAGRSVGGASAGVTRPG